MLYGHDVHPDEFNNPMMATGRAAASQTQKSEATTKKSSNNRKTVDWTREETEELLQAWGPKFEELKKVSTKERGRIWSEIYNKYKERFTESVRTLPQLKKRIQNLEYEFAVVAIPKLFFFDGGSVTAVVDAVAASAGVVDIAEKFERFLAKERVEGHVEQDLFVLTA